MTISLVTEGPYRGAVARRANYMLHTATHSHAIELSYPSKPYTWYVLGRRHRFTRFLLFA